MANHVAPDEPAIEEKIFRNPDCVFSEVVMEGEVELNASHGGRGVSSRKNLTALLLLRKVRFGLRQILLAFSDFVEEAFRE